ncbi:ATP-dependent zinc protease family protein [Poseidonibacter ostreae]|uniref:Retropepsin-like aspartic endopeptidase domain-containing protein n=1 Tax=Poseidonibacter ostreae TaxID=2654171 RepID=A0A6L4WQ43_9BACT|nr:RimK/LysX family protein [Poseidonibacter ostreae]KAB7881937.1 hypothetical protein GA417_14070 [Poseidonibacter ostreae]KAB7886626.1 hypothetical protein GBG19_11850 [Poseidonibacter ostreae]KAB7889236.1 hypothetical protein GBG18_11390 [Poseidonibacter ostreae]MAC82648.1 hypothetical protein [Arcobacter sp.]
MNKLVFILVTLLFSFQSLSAKDLLIGKYDRLDLPVLKLKNLRAKIDTGAKTSSLHCSYIKQIDENSVEFDVLDDTHKKYKEKIYTMPIKRVASVRSSNGIVEKRFVISTKVVIFDNTYDVEFTLRNRAKMNYPILLGREFLKQGFLVDVREEYLSYSEEKIK